MPENMEKKKITSTVVMSKSFREEREKRDQSREQRERHFRSRKTSNNDYETLGSRRHQRRGRDSPDRGGNRERIKLSDRFSRHTRDKEEENDNDKRRGRDSRRDHGRNVESERADSWRGRRGRDSKSAFGQERRSVFDRLDRHEQGPRRNRPMGRGQMAEDFRDDRMVEVEVNPQDVPRGKRYFMHDDREMPRRSMGRARSRSPIWSHDMWEEVAQEDEPEETNETTVKEEKQERERDVEDRDRGRPREEKRSRRVFR